VILHQMWVGGPLPQQHAAWIDGVKAMHPQWEHRLWGDDDLRWLANRDVYDDAVNRVPDHKVGQFRSNVARYEILHRFGGVWLDTDVEALAPLDSVWGPEAWAGWERQDEWVGTSILGGQAGAPFWEACIAGVRDKAYPAKQEVRFVTRLFRERGGLHVYPEKLFYPYRTTDIGSPPDDYGDALIAHHWNHLRTMRGVPL
jgi:mannosyltransferase OCH1-like enzyme